MVTDIRLSSQTFEGDIYAEFTATLNFENITLPAVQYELIHPQTSQWLGQINLGTLFSGETELNLGINLSAIANIPGVASAQLPNGMKIPVGGINDVNVIQIPIANHRGEIYIAMESGIAMIGVAINIAGLDRLGEEVGTSGFFPMFQIKDVKGIAGLFSSNTPGKNGIALFVDLSSVINPEDLLHPLPQTQTLALKSSFIQPMLSTSYQSSGSAITEQTNSLFFVDQMPNRKKTRAIQRILYRLNQDNANLDVE